MHVNSKTAVNNGLVDFLNWMRPHEYQVSVFDKYGTSLININIGGKVDNGSSLSSTIPVYSIPGTE